jgi:hypothetical protein
MALWLYGFIAWVRRILSACLLFRELVSVTPDCRAGANRAAGDKLILPTN